MSASDDLIGFRAVTLDNIEGSRNNKGRIDWNHPLLVRRTKPPAPCMGTTRAPIPSSFVMNTPRMNSWMTGRSFVRADARVSTQSRPLMSVLHQPRMSRADILVQRPERLRKKGGETVCGSLTGPETPPAAIDAVVWRSSFLCMDRTIMNLPRAKQLLLEQSGHEETIPSTLDIDIYEWSEGYDDWTRFLNVKRKRWSVLPRAGGSHARSTLTSMSGAKDTMIGQGF